jgi:NAD+ diphosphatase
MAQPPTLTPTMAFAGNPLDRAGDRRIDEGWLADMRAAGLYLPFWQDKPLVRDGQAGFQHWSPELGNGTCIFLGVDKAQAYFAIDLASEAAPALPGEFQEMRAAAFVLPGRDTAIAGQAKALLDWHGRHRFCPNCGTLTSVADGGWRRLCPQCGAEHFPRTDPVVIMLPVFKGKDGQEDECLLGRNARFINGLWSAFAGFIEPGETLEEAVRRELKEETGLAVGKVSYEASQPWPFPSSLMLGCTVQALSRDFKIDGIEIAQARWMTKSEVQARLAEQIVDEIKLPAGIAIARHLIRSWVEKPIGEP